ncbi:hypothetical protein [Shimia sp. SDUM112013]|uniref:hypothetical protein n=1 Tax=Shimia sp. SDUM112013 TaxID=3136160 RepID=UPI0032EBAC67
MVEVLSRLKPDPIPAIHPVPEHAALGELAAVYERTKRGLGVPWMGVVAMAFAQYPTFYETLWSGLEPIVGTKAFAAACEELRAVAEREANALGPLSVLEALRGQGYGAEEIAEIRACNEVFSAGNMAYVLMATLARLLLEGHDWDGQGGIDPVLPAQGDRTKPTLMEAHHASPDLAALFADLRDTLGLPFVNTDYRAFARWPSYFLLGWQGLKPAIQSRAYEPAVTRVHDAAVALARDLPNPTGLSPDLLTAAARRDASPNEVLSVVRLFQWLLPGLAVNVGFLRQQLVGAGVLTS